MTSSFIIINELIQRLDTYPKAIKEQYFNSEKLVHPFGTHPFCPNLFFKEQSLRGAVIVKHSEETYAKLL
jgi:uncharacterized protein with von Willebrand factor type A (vWA) domain